MPKLVLHLVLLSPMVWDISLQGERFATSAPLALYAMQSVEVVVEISLLCSILANSDLMSACSYVCLGSLD